MQILRNAEVRDGFEPGIVKMAYREEDGHWRHLEEYDLKAAGIVNSLTLGVPMTNAELDRMGEYHEPTSSGQVPVKLQTYKLVPES